MSYYWRCTPFFRFCCQFSSRKTVVESDEAVEFNEQFLLNSSANIDISRYAYGNPVLAGTYRVKVNLNNALKSTSEITFNENGTPRASACLTPLLLTRAGVDPAAMRDDVEVDDNTTCLDIKILPRCDGELRFRQTGDGSQLPADLYPETSCRVC